MRNDNNKFIMIGVIAFLVIVLSVLVIIAIADLNSRDDHTVPNPSTSATEPEQKDRVIETPYGQIVFPGKYDQYLKVNRVEEPDLQLDFIAEFESGRIQKLFTLRFGAPQAPAVGQLVSSDGVVVGVYVTVHTFAPDGTWQVKESTAVREMQEALNDILDAMELNPVGSPTPDIDGEDLVLETPHGKLYFPGQWAEELKITVDETDGYEILFQGKIGEHDPIKLFTINFGGGTGTVVHTMRTENGVTYYVRLRTFPLETDGWSTVDQATAVAMQEDLNHLLGKLRDE